jgi:hypothetical protein
MTWRGYQKEEMLRNLGGQTFKEMSAEAGVDNDLDGRGIAMADFDNDDLLDFFQTNADQPALLYRSNTEGAGNWAEFRLTGAKSNRDATGARIRITADGMTQIREISGGNGSAGQSMERTHFGLDDASKVDSVEIVWPNGSLEKTGSMPVNAISCVVEGKGLAP